MATQLLIIHQQLIFMVALKQALERTGGFEVHPFTTVEAAFEYFSEHPQDIALVDFALDEMPGEAIVARLRAIVRDLPILATPTLPGDVLGSLNLQGAIDTPINARELIPILNRVLEEARGGLTRPTNMRGRTLADESDKLPPAQTQQATPPPKSLPEFSTLDTVLSEFAESDMFDPPVQEGDTPVYDEDAGTPEVMMDEILRGITPGSAEYRASTDFLDLVNSMRREEPHKPLHERSQPFVEFILDDGMETLLTEIERTRGTGPLTTFEQLAEEEPPPPSLEENGTVGDLMVGVGDSGFNEVLAILRGEEVEQDPTAAKVSTEEFARFYEYNRQAEATEQITAPEPPPTAPEMEQVEEPTEQAEEALESPAHLILSTTLDESQPSESFTISELIASIERQLPQHRPNVQPLPSWTREMRRMDIPTDEVADEEPDFLPDLDLIDDSHEQMTRPSKAQIVRADDQFETEMLERAPKRTEFFNENLDQALQESDDVEFIPVESAQFEPIDLSAGEHPDAVIDAEWPEEPVSELVRVDEFDTGLFDTNFDRLASFEFAGTDAQDTPVFPEPLPGDPYIAQLALSLTQVSLELTAEATLLTREGHMIAFAGQLTDEDIEELRQSIADDWHANPSEARIRFITLGTSGKDYMLYSRATADNLTLSMVFSGTTPLRDIRKQGKRLLNALESVPESGFEEPTEAELPPDEPAAIPEPEPEPVAILPVPTEPVGPLTPYAFVWLLSDPDFRLTNTVSRAITTGLHTQLRERGWQIHTMEVRGEYVYLMADVPGDTPEYEIIRELKRRSAEIALAQSPGLVEGDLWGEGYLIVTPGRQLDSDEIEQFIQFERMM